MHVRELVQSGIPQVLVDVWERRGIAELTQVQATALAHDSFQTERNLLLIAPTSSGKTFIGEVAAVLTALNMRRVVYLVPMKAIAEEKFTDFKETYGDPSIGIRIVISSGDHSEYDGEILTGNYNLAVIVYEKFGQLLVQAPDILTMCGLVVLDELQLMRDRNRGSRLEMLVTRILMSPQPPRLIGLSATLRDLNGLDAWLRAEVIESRDRPVPLIEGICDLSGTISYYHSDGTVSAERVPLSALCQSPDELLSRLVEVYSPNWQILVFVSTKDATKDIAEACCRVLPSLDVQRDVADRFELLDETEFKAFMQHEGLIHRVGYHNADLDPDERVLTERLFRDGFLRVLVSTTTLAIGVNLPSDLVIVRDVERWDQRARIPIPTSEYKNAAGRAGRLGART